MYCGYSLTLSDQHEIQLRLVDDGFRGCLVWRVYRHTVPHLRQSNWPPQLRQLKCGRRWLLRPYTKHALEFADRSKRQTHRSLIQVAAPHNEYGDEREAAPEKPRKKTLPSPSQLKIFPSIPTPNLGFPAPRSTPPLRCRSPSSSLLVVCCWASGSTHLGFPSRCRRAPPRPGPLPPRHS